MEAIEPGAFLRRTADLVPSSQVNAGEVSIARLYEAGRLLFEHEFTLVDGLGDDQTRAEPGVFRRVHRGRRGGPDTNSCASCHWRGGVAGAGALQDASFLYGDGDRVGSADARNPPPLQGVGVIDRLGREMSRELRTTRDRAVERARREGRGVEQPLVAKGVSFGKLRVDATGTVDPVGIEGVDADLIVKPFGWKGTSASIRDFAQESLQIHFGIQSVDLLRAHARSPDPQLLGDGADADDPDGDGVTRELTRGQLTALVAFLALQELPVVRVPQTLHDVSVPAESLNAPTAMDFSDAWARGRTLFDEIGCASCHVPELVLESPLLRLGANESGEAVEIDLSRHADSPRIRYDASKGGYRVWLYSDLKRHDLGPENAARHVDHGVAPRQYMTRRLWGLASSPPYFHDGEKPWFDHAIEAHGGEAEDARARFRALSFQQKGALRVFLLSLSRARRLIVP